MGDIKNHTKTNNILKFISDELNNNNLDILLQKICIKQETSVELLEELATLIHTEVLENQDVIHLFSLLSAYLIQNQDFNQLKDSKKTFDGLLIRKCYDVFIAYKTHEKDLHDLKDKFKHQTHITSKQCINDFNTLQYKHYNQSVNNCKFISELYKLGVFPMNTILASVLHLLKTNNHLQIYCSCLILKIAGPTLSEFYDLTYIVNKIVLFMEEHSKDILPIIKSLILDIKTVHLNGWICKDRYPTEEFFINYHDLPLQLINHYESITYDMMAKCFSEECNDILFSFINKKEINEIPHLMNLTKTWTHCDQLWFVIGIISVGLLKDKSIRNDAGKLLNNLVKEKLLSNDSVNLGINKILDDKNMKTTFPNLLELMMDITVKLKL